MADETRRPVILELLKNLRDLDGLKKLFWQELNYEKENQPLATKGWPDVARHALEGDPILFATGGADHAFHVIYCRLSSPDLKRGLERQVVGQLLRDHPYVLFVFSNQSQSDWHFLNVKYDESSEKRRLLRRITVRQGEGLRTAVERMERLDLHNISPDTFGIPPLTIQTHHDEAFDVEKVTKDFYKEIANWYFWARDHAEFPKDAPVDAEGKPSLPLIRLLTRLIFCWFLKEKRNPATGMGLIPDTLFEAKGIKELLKDSSPEACTYYTAILQNLFFASLNTEMDTPGREPLRRFLNEGDGQRSDDHMVHQLWRHAKQLRDPNTLESLLRGIPFLNGGLFECLDDRVQKGNSAFTEEIRIDGFSSDPKKQPKLPNSLFYGAPQPADLSVAYGDSGRRNETVRPLLDILNRYHFTLTENTPFDQEVALDPELLGHVFENLLAAFNPETGTVARKATGSFYTPRVVVDWMVDQALIVYLKSILESSATQDTDKRLQRLLSWEEEGHDFNPMEVEKLIDAIDGMKAIDPSCGSGAFPMGMLQKLVHVLKKLDRDNDGWRARQLRAAEAIESGPARDEALKAIGRAFARDNDDYGRKLYLIENCLYGVDIQPTAVQIAKLRFFISLVVDQTIDSKEPNYGILPLPNLETKVVAANTLLGLHRGQLLLGSNDVKRLETELQRVRHDYFTARSYKRKKELRKEDKRLCSELAAALEGSGECTPFDAKRLAGWNPYDTNTHASFFDPGWMFGLAAGGTASTPTGQSGTFNIVIGNPPYVRQEELKNQTVIGSNGKTQPLKDVLKSQYECFTGTADLYVYFFERSLQLLRTGGVLSFITSNKYFRAGYGERLRAYLAYSTRPSVILDFGDAPVFTSIAYPAILVTQKTRRISSDDPLPKELKNLRLDDIKAGSLVLTWQPGPDIREFPEVFVRTAVSLGQSDLKPDGWRMEGPINRRLLKELREAGTPLGEYVKGRFYRGVLTGLNEAFVVDKATRDRLITEHPSSAEVLKPFLRGRDVKRWKIEFSEQYLIQIESSENMTHPWSGKQEKDAERSFAKIYPAIHARFSSRRAALVKREDQGAHFWELRSCAYWGEFKKPYIVYPELAIEPQYAYSPGELVADCTLYIIPTESPFIATVMNSPGVKYFFHNIAPKMRGGYMRFKALYMGQIPVPHATPTQQFACEGLASALIWLKGQPEHQENGSQIGIMASYLEQWLNGLVYELFFPGELHARNLNLFDETAKLNPPDLAKLSVAKKIAVLQELHSKAYNKNSALRSMLFDLKSLDVVRIIEEAGPVANKPPPLDDE